MCDHVDRIMDRIEDLDENNTDFKRELRTVERDLEAMEAKAGRNPGTVLHNMLKVWHAEHVDTPRELQEYAHALWLSREQFEK